MSPVFTRRCGRAAGVPRRDRGRVHASPTRCRRSCCSSPPAAASRRSGACCASSTAATRSATPSTSTAARAADDVIFGRAAAPNGRPPGRLPAARGAHRPTSKRLRAEPPRRASARTGASARCSSPARASCIDAVEEDFEEAGRSEHLHTERFQPVIGNGGGERRRRHRAFPRVGLRGRVRARESILVGGEEAGAKLPFGCRMGICHTCVGRLTGRRRPRHPHRRDHEASGQMVRICINAPEGHVEIDL